jgi:hypothetical protein
MALQAVAFNEFHCGIGSAVLLAMPVADAEVGWSKRKQPEPPAENGWQQQRRERPFVQELEATNRRRRRTR